MQLISDLASGAARSTAAVSGVKEVPKLQRPENKEHGRSLKPVMDEYIPEEKQEPSGRYWLGKDADGRPRIYFDDPERASDAPEKQDGRPDADSPDKNREADAQGRKAINGRKAEACTGCTDTVDREIEKLKKKQEELRRQINSETDNTKIKELEKKLAQIESELRQKDNDTYRRQHSKFS